VTVTSDSHFLLRLLIRSTIPSLVSAIVQAGLDVHNPVMPFLVLLLAWAAVTPPHPDHWKPVPPETAAAWLGFSGATLSIRSVDDPKRPGTARRVLTLAMPDGVRRSLALADGGGHAGNNSLNLYQSGEDRFLLISERDCVTVEPIRGAVGRCLKPQACRSGRTFLGRFDWMNGFDLPQGAFHFAFRFLPAHDVATGSGC